MSEDDAFARQAASLFRPGMGTEHVAPLLANIVRMTRPRRVLEVGLGYTTLFLLDALAKAAADHARDLAALAAGESERGHLLNRANLKPDYAPLLIGIDDFSLAQSTSPRALAAAQALGLDSRLKLLRGDFRAVMPGLAQDDLPLDLVWFDCGGAQDGADFLKLCWPLLARNYGLLALHYTYWPMEARFAGKAAVPFLRPNPILDEIKRQLGAIAGPAQFEVLSLLEPHKTRQGSVTLVRKLPPQDRPRDDGAPFAERFTLS